MTPEQIASLEAASKEAAKNAAANPADENLKKVAEKALTDLNTAKALSQDAVKQELENQKKKSQFSEREKAEYNLRKQAEKAKEHGIDPLSVLGAEPQHEDEVPEWYKKEQAKTAQKTALDLAEGIADPDIKNLVKQYLSTRILPSGDPESDFRLAYGAVNALRNKQILEDVNRRISPRSAAAGASQPGNTEEQFTATDVEAVFMKPPYNMSREKILAARKKAEAKQK